MAFVVGKYKELKTGDWFTRDDSDPKILLFEVIATACAEDEQILFKIVRSGDAPEVGIEASMLPGTFDYMYRKLELKEEVAICLEALHQTLEGLTASTTRLEHVITRLEAAIG